ncbi:hypothetical protein [Phormidesmis priestleyi]
MRICLERKLTTCPDQLVCTVCREPFFTGKIRTLLYSDRRLLQGDICSVCLKLSATGIRKKMREQASLLMQQPAACFVQTIPCHDRAIELLEASQEDVRFPTFLQWWLKKLEILSEESQELEAARLRAKRRSYLQKMLDQNQET